MEHIIRIEIIKNSFEWMWKIKETCRVGEKEKERKERKVIPQSPKIAEWKSNDEVSYFPVSYWPRILPKVTQTIKAIATATGCMQELHRRSLNSIDTICFGHRTWTGNFLPARWVYRARSISRLQRENSCQRPSLAIHTATIQNQHFVKNILMNATRAQLFQIQPVSVRLEGLLHKISISGTESQMESPWLERSWPHWGCSYHCLLT